jgi:hypothetical protein
MTDLPDADPNLKVASELGCDSVHGATPAHGPAEAEKDGFNFWRDVIGDDIVSGGIVYSSDEWTHEGEGDVHRLTPTEKAARDTNRLHPNNPDHPEVAAAYAALATEHDDALRRDGRGDRPVEPRARRGNGQRRHRGHRQTRPDVPPDELRAQTAGPPQVPRPAAGHRPLSDHHDQPGTASPCPALLLAPAGGTPNVANDVSTLRTATPLSLLVAPTPPTVIRDCHNADE